MDIPEAEIEWTFTPSGGPGGQHANRSSTRVELRWDVANSRAIAEHTRRLLLERLEGINKGIVTVTADRTRSQWRNRAEARRRLQERVDAALRPRKRRQATVVPSRVKAKRRDAKKRRSQLKRLRRPPDVD